MLCQTAVSETTSTERFSLPYQLLAVMALQTVDGSSDSGRIFGNDREVRQPLAFEARSSHLPGVAWWSQFVKSSIQGQAAYEGDRLSQMSAAVQELQGSVSEIVAVADLSVWVPAPHQKK